MHFEGLKIVWDCNVNSGVGQLLILNPLILIDKVIGSEAIVLVRGLRRVPPGNIATGPFAHGLRRAINMLLALFRQHPPSNLPIHGPSIHIHRPVPHVPLELRTGVAED